MTARRAIIRSLASFPAYVCTFWDLRHNINMCTELHIEVCSTWPHACKGLPFRDIRVGSRVPVLFECVSLRFPCSNIESRLDKQYRRLNYGANSMESAPRLHTMIPGNLEAIRGQASS